VAELCKIDASIGLTWKFALDNVFFVDQIPVSGAQTATLRENWLYDDTHYRKKDGTY
jgi:hypothetical protein